MSEIDELVEKIETHNEAYRLGRTLVSDEVYDSWVDRLEEIDPDNQILSEIGLTPENNSRKQKLKIPMASMNKVKTINNLISWMVSKKIPKDTEFVLMPKLDGCSFCSDESTGEGYTRGDGEFGQRSDEHLRKTGHKLTGDNVYTFGEIIMKRKTFNDKYSMDFANGRNFVAGLLNSDNARDSLTNCDYIRYGLVSFDEDVEFSYKTEVLDYLNNSQTIQVPYKTVKMSELSIDNLTDLYNLWEADYEIDGIIIEVNDLEYANKIGREKNDNPAFARAIKLDLAERKTAKVLNLEYNISKNGDVIPRANIEATKLDGVEIQWITCNNARYVKDMGIGIGCIVEFIRSGGVIPLITDVIETVTFELPELGYELEWDENDVHLRTVHITDEQRLQEIISFFNILDVDAVKEGVITQLFESGYNTVKKILSMSKSDLLALDRFGERKAEQVYSNIHHKMKDVILSKLMHSSNKFTNLGSKKLLLLEGLENPTFSEICNIEGFSDISAQNYLDGIGKFNEFLEDLGDLVSVKKTEKMETTGSDLEDMVVVFSGIRRADLNEIIESRGGRVASGVSSKITHLIMKTKNSGSSKEEKALVLGKEILTVEELEEILGF